MLEKSVKVILPAENGLHARPATKFVEAALRFSSDIHITKDGVRVNGKSVIEILTLAAEQDAQLLITASGPDAEEAVNTLAKLVKGGFKD
jgi:phosphotransferase system HPr (HPr) family protein